MDACSMQFFCVEIHPFLAELLINTETASSQVRASRGFIFILSTNFFAFIFFLFGLNKKGMPVYRHTLSKQSPFK